MTVPELTAELTSTEVAEEGMLDNAVCQPGAQQATAGRDEAISILDQWLESACAEDCQGPGKLQCGLGPKGCGMVVEVWDCAACWLLYGHWQRLIVLQYLHAES